MMLTTKGRYAVMAMVDLASHSKRREDKPISLQEIAVRQEITQAYLEQLFTKLRKSGLVTSVRGPGGGYRLARKSEEITIASIVLSQEENITMTRCHDKEGGCMSTTARCLTHDLWDGMSQYIHHYLASITLADVCNRSITIPRFPHEGQEVCHG